MKKITVINVRFCFSEAPEKTLEFKESTLLHDIFSPNFCKFRDAPQSPPHFWLVFLVKFYMIGKKYLNRCDARSWMGVLIHGFPEFVAKSMTNLIFKEFSDMEIPFADATFSQMRQEILEGKTVQEGFCSSLYWVSVALFHMIEEGKSINGINLSDTKFLSRQPDTCCSMDEDSQY